MVASAVYDDLDDGAEPDSRPGSLSGHEEASPVVDGLRAFGDALRRLRHARRLTQQELAERAQMSALGISALERGRRRAPRPDTVRLLADALGLQGEE